MRITAIVRAMVQAGCSPEQILVAVEAAEAGQVAAIDHARSVNQQRQRRFREKQARNVTDRYVTGVTAGNVTDDACIDNTSEFQTCNVTERYVTATSVTPPSPLDGPPLPPAPPTPPLNPPSPPGYATLSAREPRTKSDCDNLEAALRQAAGAERSPSPSLFDLSPIFGLIDAGFSLDEDVLPVIRAKCAGRSKPPGSWGFFVQAIHDARARRIAAASATGNVEPYRAGGGARASPVDLMAAAREGTERAMRRKDAGQ